MGLLLRRKNWDSEFFGREFYQLEIDADTSLKDLHDQLAALDSDGVFGIEVKVDVRLLSKVRELEDLGFRLVDSRMEFITETERLKEDVVARKGVFRLYQDEDWEPLKKITIENFIRNRNFQSRYTNRDIYTEEESVRYYLRWHEWVLETSPDLFLSWVDGSTYVGFYSILRTHSEDSELPTYKVGLAAIDPEYRSLDGQNLMQAWLFRNTIDERWITVNSPQLTNSSGVKNNIRSNKRFQTFELFLFRRNPLRQGNTLS